MNLRNEAMLMLEKRGAVMETAVKVSRILKKRDIDGAIIGGVAVATFTQKALAGIIAHELAHFAAGDTRLARQGAKRAATIRAIQTRVRIPLGPPRRFRGDFRPEI